jgi:hypothetical protein
MAIYRLLKNSTLGPEEISRVIAAFEQALHTLCVKDRDDPLTEMIAKKIIRSRKPVSMTRRSFRLKRSQNCAPGRAASVGGLFQFECRLLARLRRADEQQECLLIGVDRKGPADGRSDAIDPHFGSQRPPKIFHSCGPRLQETAL